MAQKKQQKISFGIPLAIIVTGVLVGSAIIFAGNGTTRNLSHDDVASATSAANSFRLPGDEDHIRGNPDAPISVIEYSDFECPFCARLHPTLARVIAEQEDVKWIYRHFPLTTIHSRALRAATASECVGKLGGNDAFWKFADSLFENQRRLGNTLYEQVATELKVDSKALISCMSDNSITVEVEKDFNEARNAGGRGTPFGLVVTASGKLMPFSGSLTYEQLSGLINEARRN